MKLFIILLFLSFNCFAVKHYVARMDIGICNKMQYSGPKSKEICENESVGGCQIYTIYNCRYHIKGKVNVDDTTKPKFTKSEVESCTIETCDSILQSKTCSDPLETVYKNLDWMQVYCSKFDGYQQKEIDGIVEDPAKKAVYDAEVQIKIDAKVADEEELVLIKADLQKINSSNLAVWHKRLLKRLVRKLK